MICGACGWENKGNQRFCTNCGARLALLCPQCQSPAEPDQKFCGQCGARLAAEPAIVVPTPAPVMAPAPPLPPPAPAYELQGERKQLTVMFADIKGSMDMQADLDPEEWANIMDRFVRLLAEGVQRYDGMVDKFTGDGIMALFGAPIALEDHARRACLAALYLVEAIPRYADELLHTRGLILHVRLGLNSGEAVVGRVGEDLRLDAVGPTVGLAQRMEAMAEPGRAYLTEHTARLVQGAFRLTDLGPREVKGLREPMRVYVLDGANTSFRASRPEGTSGMVGRHQEMAILEDALARAGEGEPQIVGVVGEAGVGKSRLCEEFCASVAQRGITVRRTAGVSHGRTVPLLPVLSLIRDYFEVDDSLTPAEVRAKVGARILELAPNLADDLPLFFDFIEVRDPATPLPALAPEVRLRRVFEMLGQITASRSAEGLFVFLLEDLQWVDPQSLGFFERMVQTLPGSRTLVVTNARPGFSTDWMQRPFYRQLSLLPLREEAVGELVGEMLGVDLSLAPLVGFVAERTGGNPYFVEEVVRALLEDGTVTGQPGAYQLTCDLAQVKIPPSVHAVVAARIDRLPPAQKSLLQTASVIGRTFSQAVVARVSDLAGDELTQALEALCQAQLLEEDPGATAGSGTYRFWQALTQEVAYGTLLAGRRKALHAAVAEALAAEEPDRLDETAAILSWHWQRADRRIEAARWGVRAANFGLRSDLVDALRRFQAAVDLLDGVDETPETLALGVRARIRLLQFGARIGIGPEQAHRLFDEARERAERLGNIGLRGMATISYGATLSFAGDVVGGLERCREAAVLGEDSDDDDVRAALLIPLCFTLSYVGPLPEALAAADRVLEVCAGNEARGATVLGHGVLARSLQFRGSILLRMGRIPEAREALERSIEIARRRNESETLVWALSLYAQLPWLAGETVDSGPAAEAVQIAEDTGNITGLVLALRSLAVTRLAEGRDGDAIAASEHALDEGRRNRSGLFEEAPLLAVLARARLATGDLLGANTAADEAVEAARAQQAQVTEAQVLLARAHVRRMSAMPRADVYDDLDAAVKVVEVTGAGVFEPFIAEERARLDEDRSALADAERLFRSIGALGQAARLEAELNG